MTTNKRRIYDHAKLPYSVMLYIYCISTFSFTVYDYSARFPATVLFRVLHWENGVFLYRQNLDQSQNICLNPNVKYNNFALFFPENQRKMATIDHFYRATLYVQHRFCPRICEPSQPLSEKQKAAISSNLEDDSNDYQNIANE